MGPQFQKLVTIQMMKTISESYLLRINSPRFMKEYYCPGCDLISVKRSEDTNLEPWESTKSALTWLKSQIQFFFYQDLPIPHTTLINILDYSKGFNRINHNIILEHLDECKVPGWLLRIMMGYLSERKLKIRFKDDISEAANLPGGGGQGMLLGL